MSTESSADKATVSENREVEIPAKLAERYGIEPGDEVRWEDLGDGLELKASNDGTGNSVIGFAVDEDVNEEDRREFVEEAEEHIREKRETEWNRAGQ